MVLIGSLFTIVVKADKEAKVLNEIARDERVFLVEDKENYSEVVTSGVQLFTSGENLNLLQAMGKIDFWLLFFAMSCGTWIHRIKNSNFGVSLEYLELSRPFLWSLCI